MSCISNRLVSSASKVEARQMAETQAEATVFVRARSCKLIAAQDLRQFDEHRTKVDQADNNGIKDDNDGYGGCGMSDTTPPQFWSPLPAIVIS